MKDYLNNVISIEDILIDRFVQCGYICLDATVGNGNDTIKLSQKVGKIGKVYGFDIQEIAIEITKEKLTKADLLSQTILINDDHTKVDKYISEKLDFAIYNLGYLPGSHKEITTIASTTLESINKTLSLLKENGVILIISYINHDGGYEEYKAVRNYLSLLDQKKYNIFEVNFINQINNPPRLFCIENRGGK
ncbi:MAG TPA: class I SAM-dependent methyltransferase [Soehngenia sp.]|nr:class I SAM-dependent methyltransferase [Soehngenia sp.]